VLDAEHIWPGVQKTMALFTSCLSAAWWTSIVPFLVLSLADWSMAISSASHVPSSPSHSASA